MKRSLIVSAALTAISRACHPIPVLAAAPPPVCTEPMKTVPGFVVPCAGADLVPVQDLLDYEQTEEDYDLCLDKLALEKTACAANLKACAEEVARTDAARLACENSRTPPPPPLPEEPAFYETGEFWAVTVGVVAFAGGLYLGWELRGER